MGFRFVSGLLIALCAFGLAGYAQHASLPVQGYPVLNSAARELLPDAPSAGTARISGTVLDTNGDIVEGARVTLTANDGHQLVVDTLADGQFTFAGLTPGVFKVTVTGPDMGTYSSPEIRLEKGEFRIVSGVVLPVARANTSVTVSANSETIAEEEVQVEIQQRVLGVFPNFYTSYDWNAAPLGRRQKFELAFHAATDPVAFAGAGVLAGIQQANNTYPEYGQGLKGYGRRFGAAYGNDVISRMLSSAVLPSVLHQDPRYFYKGTGTVMERARYAVMSVFVCRGDNGKPQPNASHLLGSFAAGAISNAYYPQANRGASLVMVNGLIEMAGNAGNNLLREFLFKRISNQAGKGN